jgi:glutamate N-acetyltransferase/amino-acid N-acetyltransferase
MQPAIAAHPGDMEPVEGNVVAPVRFLASGLACGIKESGALDLALIYSEVPCVVAGAFTTNRMCAAPVQVSRDRVARGRAQCVVANSGNANCATGPQGLQDALEMAALAADAVGCPEEMTLVASTGKIGVPLPMEEIRRGTAAAATRLGRDADSADAASRAILTTDTVPKQIAVQFAIGGPTVRIGGIAKGAGMICPQMATMLCFLTTDAAIERAPLQEALSRAVDLSFNRITVDGDMSTNDTVILLANGCAGNATIRDTHSPGYGEFLQALQFIATHLACAIVRDGEGATKLVTITVEGAPTDQDAHRIAKSIANSPLVKTALHGADPNWGRIASSAGAAGVDLRPEDLRIWFDDLLVAERGAGSGLDPAAAREILLRDQYAIRVRVGEGPGSATVWTCDLSEEYVSINAEYLT